MTCPPDSNLWRQEPELYKVYSTSYRGFGHKGYNTDMSLPIETSVDLTPLNTLGIAASADYLIRITKPEQIPEAIAFAHAKTLPWFALGEGSNIVIGTAKLGCVVLKVELAGRTVTTAADHTDIRVGAGENWDEFVAWTVAHNLEGIEALSLVPGTVGAAPVQNVGAYGQEVSSTITEIEAYDTQTSQSVTLSNADAQFGYRDSIFKHAGKRRYVITAVHFRLKPTTNALEPTYESLHAELTRRGIHHPTVADIRTAVIAIRTAKLPDPAVTPTAGSFFHNPVISADEFHKLQAAHPHIPHWPTAEGKVKLAAAWLVEQCGFKGVVKDGVGIYPKQAIALINPGHRPAADVLDFRDYIITGVKRRFGVTLQMEPELIEF